jgi:hypothetical protein
MPLQHNTEEQDEEQSTQADIDVIASEKEGTSSLSSSDDSLSSPYDSLSSSHSSNNEAPEFESCQEEIEECHCLQSFIFSCSFLLQIEIIGVGFNSVLRKGLPISRPPPER